MTDTGYFDFILKSPTSNTSAKQKNLSPMPIFEKCQIAADISVDH